VKAVAINTLDMVRGNRSTWLTNLTWANVPYVSNDIAFYEDSIEWPDESYAYTGEAIEPSVTVPGLVASEDYAVTYKNNVEVGVATVTVSGQGTYTGSASRTFKIKRAPQAIEAQNASKMLKASAETGKLAKDKVVNLQKLAAVSAKTAVEYEKANEVGGGKITVDASTGKVTVKEGLKADTYRVKFRLTAPKDEHYKAAKPETITLKLVIA
jgi:hypothetical protein